MGTYKIEDKTLILNSLFASPAMRHLIGKTEKLAIKRDGNKLFLAGTFSWGLKMEEIWELID